MLLAAAKIQWKDIYALITLWWIICTTEDNSTFIFDIVTYLVEWSTPSKNWVGFW